TPEKSAPKADSMRVRALLSSGEPGPSEAATCCGELAGFAAPPGPSLNNALTAVEARSPTALIAEAAMFAGDAAARRARISLRVRAQRPAMSSEAVDPEALPRTDCSSDAALCPAYGAAALSMAPAAEPDHGVLASS